MKKKSDNTRICAIDPIWTGAELILGFLDFPAKTQFFFFWKKLTFIFTNIYIKYVNCSNQHVTQSILNFAFNQIFSTFFGFCAERTILVLSYQENFSKMRIKNRKIR